MSSVTNKIIFCAVFGVISPLPAADTIECPRKNLAQEVAKAKQGETIAFTGVCAGPVVITAADLSLLGTGTAAIDGGGQHALVVRGVSGVVLRGFEVRGGANGILAQNGAHLEIQNVTSRGNSVSGISLQTGSSAIMNAVTLSGNQLHGLDMQTGSAATATGAFLASGNRVFGVNVNGSSLTFAQAAVTLTGNALGMQVATSANAFLNDPTTTLDATNNIATGLTVVSGGHIVSFGARINATGNGAFGVSVNSNAGLDLDAGAVLTASGNRAGGVAIQQQSVMTVFNNPQFSGVPGFSTINATGNTGNGIQVATGSQLTLANSAAINATGNGATGLLLDNGAGATLRNTVLTGNTARDLILSFGARADFQTGNNIANVSCDATVLLRGASFTCPR